MATELIFRWNEKDGEARIAKASLEKFSREDWLMRADFLADVRAEATKLYDELLATPWDER